MKIRKINSEDYNQEEIINDLKKHTIEEVCQKYGLSFRELVYVQEQKALYSYDDGNVPNFITKTKQKKYRVHKVMDKEIVDYGVYNTREDAEIIVEALKKVYWNKEKLEQIKLDHNILEYNEKPLARFYKKNEEMR